ncbi:hypothetical protein [Nocardia sp. XZ_19_369]|uniref:hypothetical protein n=1 Tax=Nocardia sp. XZ_19_369 TaxID=2769487 RepID=UPI00188FCFB2|nr:hypothetical protein [Nocardia sp. XZ_19_369]
MRGTSTRHHRPRAQATQLDLFGEVLAAERTRSIEALTCLRDAVPEALEIIATLRYRSPSDTRSPRSSGQWAYCVCRGGLCFENADDWWAGSRARGEVWGWARTPAHLITWDQLAALVQHDPRRAEICAWTESLLSPRGRLVTRPFELWPNPDQWNPGYLDSDRADPLWPQRRKAWQLVLDLLTDAIAAASTGQPGRGR